MYRALYAHKSKLPKYLSFEAGDKFTLIDTSVSDQWFLAQNGMGQIGYVPFNYIKKIDVVVEQVVKFIDGSIEAIHLQAGADGTYTQEQRMILKKLMKHRSDVIKRATLREKSPKGGNKRRPAPAPPVEKSSSVDNHNGGERPANLAVVGRSATISTSTVSDKQKTETSFSINSKDVITKQTIVGDSKFNSHRSSVASDTPVSNLGHGMDDVRKSQSVTSSIGQAPSIVSSASSISTDIDADASSENSGDVKTYSYSEDLISKNDTETIVETFNEENNETSRDHSPFEVNATELSSVKPEVTVSGKSKNSASIAEEGIELDVKSNEIQPGIEMLPQETADILSSGGTYNNDLDQDDLPPPPPDLQSGYVEDDGYFNSDYNSYSLPPAPEDGTLAYEGDETRGEESDDSDSLDLPAAKAIRECSCDDNQSKFDSEGPFTARGSLQLPNSRQLDLRRSKKRDVEMMHKTLASSVILSSSSSLDPDQREKELQRLEQLQAYLGVTVTHADCEEMIGQFRHVSLLSHEESHWALLSAMSLLADSLPHIKPSLEIVAHRFKMANQCPSTGKDYQCEDALTLEGLVDQLDSVMNDSQQRGHYLEDDLDDIIDIITTLSETLSKAKPCVSIAAIQNDNYSMIEVIARYYQMETRWLIHSCLLQLVEAICHLHPQAITEFLYSQLPLELVAEMQQHSHDDIRFLHVSRALGIVFMRGKASPHKLAMTMDLHFFIWLLGMIEEFNERGRHDDVEMLVALVCSYHLQHKDDPQNPVTEALKMAQGHALLECALSFLSKHDDPTRLLNSGVTPKLNSVVLLLTHLYDSSDTSDLLYTNDVDALIGIFQQVFRDLSTCESLHRQMLKLLHNFLRCYPDTISVKSIVSTRLGNLLHDMKDQRGLAAKILEHNKHIFDES